jgi:phosphatidylglycerol lysyltransferase
MTRARSSPCDREASPQELERARQIVLRYGWNATSYQILNPGIRLWFSTDGEAVAGYLDRHGVRVVAGAPICAHERLPAVTTAFEIAAAGMQVCYFCAGSRLRSMMAGREPHCAVLIGAQPSWDPDCWMEMLGRHASLRAQVNRARNKGVTVEEWPPARAMESKEVDRCLEEWLSTRGLPPLHFLVEPRTLERLYDRRLFVAQREGGVDGFLVASPIPARGGWLIEQIVRSRRAPNGTAELLIDAAVRTLRRESCHYITLGLSPLSTRAGDLGSGGPTWMKLLLAWTRAHAHRFYNFEGLEAFKAKFRPAVWEPIYAIAGVPEFTPRLLYAVAGAFSDRSVPSTLRRALLGAVRQEARWLRSRIIHSRPLHSRRRSDRP